MAKFYIKNEEGEFVEADELVDEEFHRRSEKIVAVRLAKTREKEIPKMREELETKMREEVTETIKGEVAEALKGEYETKIKEAEDKASKLDTELRRKSIAAEYGFKPEVEQFLGEGTDDEMRQKADALKESFTAKTPPAPEKTTVDTGAASSFVKLTEEN